MIVYERLVPPSLADLAAFLRTFNDWARILNDLLDLSLLRGRILADVPLASGVNTVAHGLGRVPQHFWATPDANVSVYSAGSHTKQFLNVQASGACTASILVV